MQLSCHVRGEPVLTGNRLIRTVPSPRTQPDSPPIRHLGPNYVCMPRDIVTRSLLPSCSPLRLDSLVGQIAASTTSEISAAASFIRGSSRACFCS